MAAPALTGGHAEVRNRVVAMLAATLPGLLPDAPLTPRFIGSGDELPDRDELWPCVLVTTTRATGGLDIGDGLRAWTYELSVVVAVRTPKRVATLAADHRDALLLAVRTALLTRPALGGDMQARVVVNRALPEETSAVSPETKERWAATGRIKFPVQTVEPVGAGLPGPPAVAAVDLAVEGHDANYRFVELHPTAHP